MATEILVSNNALSTLLAGITNVAVSASVQPGKGALFASPGAGQYQKVTFFNDVGEFEVVHLTSRTGDTLTISRGQEGTTARAWNDGDGVIAAASAGFLSILSQLDRNENVTGLKAFTAANTHAGAETHSGPETHSGIETHSGPETHAGAETHTGKETFTPIQFFDAGIGPNYLNNVNVVPSVAAKALTVAIKGIDAADPSATNKVQVSFRHGTLTNGAPAVVSAVAAASVVAPSGATLGFLAAATGYIYVYAINNAGTMELALSGDASWDEGVLHNTTAISAGADSAGVLYSTTARNGVAIRYLCQITIQTGAVAGEWDNAATNTYIGRRQKVLRTQEILATGSFVMPSATVFAALVGGGGGGGMILLEGAAGGGGAGGDVAGPMALPNYPAGTVLTVNIGAAGVGRTGSTGPGTQGGTTSVVDPYSFTVLAAPGGLGGTGDPVPAGLGGAAGTAGAQTPFGYPGLAGETGETDGNDFGGDGADSIYRSVKSGAGYAGGLGSTANNLPGAAPLSGVYGAGGGGGTGTGVGGNGSAGAAYFWWWE